MPQRTAITFEEFMQRALYDPVHGYYTRRITGVGHRGDFTTAPMLSDAPARAIAVWIRHALRDTGCRHLIEIGPGEGRLSAAVLRHLPWHIRWKTRLHLVENSAPLKEIQRKTLGNKATWHTTPAAALAACDGNAVIFSNELVDAFPVRRFQNTNDGWCELALKFLTDETPEEILLSPAPLPDSTSFSQTHPLDQWIEVHESYHKWLLEWLPMWKRGKMLTIDYGATAQDLYHRRPRGTLRGYLLQQPVIGPAIYQNPGRQDLTADVNFTDLMKWSAPWTREQKLQTFAAFLKTHAPQADHPFTDEQSAGGAFLVLEETRKSAQAS
ncbi:MAG: SAM-dependent methyltransferase [Gloeobacteraceae cyanobacterium ES-bin-144]|nr:SAM-dependent methyltransferase [Verrucomicrobiales bacterium]